MTENPHLPEQPQQVAWVTEAQTTESQAPPQMPPATAGRGLALTALITGVLGLLLLAVFMFTGAGVEALFGALILGLLGLIFGIIGLKKRQSKGMSITGLITGILAMLGSLGWFVFALVFIGAFMSAMS